MKLLLINDHGIQGGGSENRIRLLLQEFLKRKIFEEIHLIASKDSFSLEGIIFHKCNKNGFSLTKKIIREHAIDIVQVHNLMDIGPWPILAAKLLKKPVIFFAHDYWPVCGRRSFIPAETASKKTLCNNTNVLKCSVCIGPRSTMKLKLWKRIVNLADMGISATFAMKNLYEREGVLKKKWYIVPPWINVEKFSQKCLDGKKENIILFVSSLVEWKGAWVAAKALRFVVERVPDAQLVFIGDSQELELPYRGDIENICRADGTLSRVRFLGKLDWDQIQQWHHRSKVFIFPTICMESFGLAWAEAMASGCPVIVSSIGSVAELATRAKVVVPRDEKELAKAIVEILENPVLAENMSLWGRQYALSNFDVNDAATKLIEIYDSFLSKKELI